MRHRGHAALLVCCVMSACAGTQGVAERTAPRGAVVATDVPYREGELSPEMRARCVLDVYTPAGAEMAPVIVWFHAGGLMSGEKFIPEGFKDRGVAVVAANYRLHPSVGSPAYVEDAAAAVAWTVRNIERYGGDPARVVVSGHSAGGWLASMIALDPSYLAAHGIEADSLAGCAPVSGHTITHFTVRAERGIPGTTAIVDDMAPLFHVRSDAPPLLLITGDREQELLGRYEETAYFWRMMRVVEHPDTTLIELEGFDHGGVVDPAQPLIIDFVRRVTGGTG